MMKNCVRCSRPFEDNYYNPNPDCQKVYCSILCRKKAAEKRLHKAQQEARWGKVAEKGKMALEGSQKATDGQRVSSATHDADWPF
jgi:hypothetical protein